ncbi:hypothetical protein JCM8208_003963 [Rhodotorula glutinis]
MVSSKAKRTSATRRSLPLAPAASNSRLAPPPPPSTTSAKPLPRSASTPSHSRTRSFLTGLLERSAGSKRLSEPPSRRQPPSTKVGTSPMTAPVATTSSAARPRAPAVQKKRLSAPVDFKGKASVSLPLNLAAHLSPVEDTHTSPASRSSRSSPYLTSKPLPLDGDEKMRLAAWDFGDAGSSSPQELDKGKSRAFDDDVYEYSDGERALASAPIWTSSSAEETLADFDGTRSHSMPVLAGTSRLSVASDTSSMIAWAGPSLTSPPLVRPSLAAADTFASRYSIPYHLSPILESDSTSDGHLGPVSTSTNHPSVCAHETTTTATARPVLHIDPPRRPTRMHSDMSMSVYSRQSIAMPEREHDGGDGGALDWGEELLSYFSPDTPEARSQTESQLEGLAIRGATTMPRPTPMSLEGEVIFDPLPAPSVPSQIVLSARPSFSAFAFPSSASLATTLSASSSEQASHAASPLFDAVRASAAPSTFTVATSVFDDAAGDGQDGASSTEKDAQGADGGMWRADWGWEMYRRSPEPVVAAPTDDSPNLSPLIAKEPLASSAPASPKGRTTSVSPPTFAIDLAAARSASPGAVSPVLLPLAARALRKREKSLPSIPDNASMWSGAAGVPVPSGETMHVEVFCTRELVRCGKYGERRVVVERTLLFTEDA